MLTVMLILWFRIICSIVTIQSFFKSVPVSFVGNVVLCALDSERDYYPKNVLSSYTNNSTDSYYIKA